MKIFLVGGATHIKRYLHFGAPYILLSYWDIKNWDPALIQNILDKTEMFLLDSGAFSFLHLGKNIDWDAYLDQYAAFINKWDIDYFFELDIDNLIGSDETKRLTNVLEAKTRKKAIPVFHACRGIERWREMCREYDFVAISAAGYFAETKWTDNKDALRKMIAIAHDYGAKVHGLGYTRLANLNRTTVPFDSVDSTSCISGEKYATAYKFTGSGLITKKMNGHVKDYKTLDDHNYQEWIKMCRYKAKDDKW